MLIFSKNFRTNLLFQFCPIRAKTQNRFPISRKVRYYHFSFQKFSSLSIPFLYIQSSPVSDREIDLARSRVTFRFIVIPLLFLLCSNCVWVRIGNDSERVIDLWKGWREPRDYPFIGSIFASRWMEGTFDRGSIISPQRCQCK